MADVLKPSHGGALRPFRPGQSGNPGGRTPGIRACIRRRFGRDGRKLVDALGAIAFGKPEQVEAIFGERLRPKVRDRIEALRVLVEHGHGRPQPIDDGPGGAAPPQIIFNIPRPARELEGQHVVMGYVRRGDPP